MALFAWFDTLQEQEFVARAAGELARRMPPASLVSSSRKKAERVERMHEAVLAGAKEFARGRRPNLYQKAVLSQRFQQALRDAGYPEELVRPWTFELNQLLAGASLKPEP